MESTESSGERKSRASTRSTRFWSFLAVNLNQSALLSPSRMPWAAQGGGGSGVADLKSALGEISLTDSSGETVIQWGEGAERFSWIGKTGKRSRASAGRVMDCLKGPEGSPMKVNSMVSPG